MQLNKKLKILNECGNLTQMWKRQMKIIRETSFKVLGTMQLNKQKTLFHKEFEKE